MSADPVVSPADTPKTRCYCLDPGCDGWAKTGHLVQSWIGATAEREAAHFDALADRFPFLGRWYRRRAWLARRIARNEEVWYAD